MHNYIRQKLYPVWMLLSKTKIKYRLQHKNEYEMLPDRPVIFAFNHSAFPDIPLAMRSIGKHSYVLLGRQRLWKTDKLFFELNGCIWVDRKDRSNTNAAKAVLTKHLEKGRNILWFPEGTWNLTDNLLMLPMKWGIIEVARNAGAQIIPAALMYDREKLVCHVSYGTPIVPPPDNLEGIRLLRDSMATLRWEQYEADGVLKRSEVDVEELRAEQMSAVEEYSPLQWDYEQSIIYHPYVTEAEAFSFMEKLIPGRENAFLLWKRQE